jgi:hypothetical protein
VWHYANLSWQQIMAMLPITLLQAGTCGAPPKQHAGMLKPYSLLLQLGWVFHTTQKHCMHLAAMRFSNSEDLLTDFV